MSEFESEEFNPPRVGGQLGQFRLTEHVATGAMGLVFTAIDTALDRPVVIKVLSPRLAQDAETAARFIREARATAGLSHPNIARVYNAGEQNGYYYFAMELVQGGTLEALRRPDNPCEPYRAVALIRQAALGLHDAQEHGLIHGDVKPANLLRTPDDDVKVSDFGLARRVTAGPSAASTQAFSGSPETLSPEAAAGALADHRSDIYSLGIVLYELLTGRRPYGGETPAEVLRSHLDGVAVPVSQVDPRIPAHIEMLVTKMTALRPAERYQTYSILIKALEGILAKRPAAIPEAQPIAAQPGTPQHAKPRPVRAAARVATRPALVTGKTENGPWPVLLAVVVAVVAVLGGAFWYRSRPAPPAAPAPQTVTVDKESAAQAALAPLKRAADEAIAEEHYGRAFRAYQPWPQVQFAGTTADQFVTAERRRLSETARRWWTATQTQIITRCATNQFAEATALCVQAARSTEGLADLAALVEEESARVRTAEERHAAQLAAQRDEIGRSLRAKVDKLCAQVAPLIVGFRWEQASAEITRLRSEVGEETIPALEELQTEADTLLVLRQGVLDRLSAPPGWATALQTSKGVVDGTIIKADAQKMVLRRKFGDAGFADTAVAWTDVLASERLRVFRSRLDPKQADEVFGYAVMATHQALARQGALDEARGVVQALSGLNAPRQRLMETYLRQLDDAGAMRKKELAVQQVEQAAAALWGKIRAAATRNDWETVESTIATLMADFQDTKCVTEHATEIAELMNRPTATAPLLPGAKLTLWNTHNGEHNDSGTKRCDVLLFLGAHEVWRQNDVRTEWIANKDCSTMVNLPFRQFDRVRIVVTEWCGSRGGLAEVELSTAGGRKVSPNQVTASAYYRKPWLTSDPYRAEMVIDGEPSSEKAGIHYWLLPDGTSGWIDIEYGRPATAPAVSTAPALTGAQRTL